IRKYIVLYLENCVGCQGTSPSWTVLTSRDRDSNPNDGGCVGVRSCRLQNTKWTQEWSYVKISFDVAFNKQGNRSCSGTIIRDSNGRVLGSKTAIQMGLDLGFLTVEIERDALL
ncbi:hypothetical protein Gogos_020507, partial [Gossypium gossypioides]|nr:hypothetical protein [Gossypium gossypioides]